MIRRIRNFFSSPPRLAIINAILLGITITVNINLQAFCWPSLWASVVLFICFVNTVIYPLLAPGSGIYNISSFVSGISFGVFIYCIIFLGHIHKYSILLVFFFGFGLVIYIPHFLAIQLFQKYIIKQTTRKTKRLFLGGFMVTLITSAVFGIQYRIALHSIENFKKSGWTILEPTWMNEKILGMYFKYHTEICEWDGWRPPIHEPALVIGQWLNGKQDPLGLSYWTPNLGKRIHLYKKFFPGKPVKFECSCAIEERYKYERDPVFDTP